MDQKYNPYHEPHINLRFFDCRKRPIFYTWPSE